MDISKNRIYHISNVPHIEASKYRYIGYRNFDISSFRYTVISKFRLKRFVLHPLAPPSISITMQHTQNTQNGIFDQHVPVQQIGAAEFEQ